MAGEQHYVVRDLGQLLREALLHGGGIDAGRDRCNPVLWQIRFRDMLSESFYLRIRGNFFRLHYQFIMAGDRRASYDYFMFVCGPVSVADWASRGREVLCAFSSEGRYQPTAARLPGSS